MLSRLLYPVKKIGSLFLLISLILPAGLYSQKPSLRFQHFTIEQGLAQSSVFCILQDKKGFMWFGTEQGLNRFDGYNFVVHKFQPNDPNSLNSNYILSIHEDPAGILWIGTDGGGLNKFDPETAQFSYYLVDPQSLDSFANIINVIFEDRSGELWIGTAGGGLHTFARKNGTFTHFPIYPNDPDSLSHNTINAIFEDSSGTLRIGTDRGLKQLDRGMKQMSSTGLAEQKVLAIYEDRAGQLWIGTDNGFYTFESGTGQLVHYQVPASGKDFYRANEIKTFYEDRSGAFWIGAEHGLHLFNRRTKTYHSFYAEPGNPYGLSANRISVIYEDRSGALWVGVQAGALNKLNSTRQSFKSYHNDPKNPDSISFRNVFALYEDGEGVLWIGTYGSGLSAFNRETGKITNYRNNPEDPSSLSDDNIWSICEDGQGMLWIGTAGGGLNRLSRKTGKFTRYQHQPQNPYSLGNNQISSIIEDRKGNLWIATNGGLNKLAPQKNQFMRYQTNPKKPNTLVHNNVYVLHEDHLGMLWIGTKRGLSIFDVEKETFTSYRLNPRDPNSMIPHPIYSICEDREGIIWIGTTDGLYKIDREKDTFSYYSEKDGLPNDVINGILEDGQGNLWLSTNKGVSKFNPGTGKFRNYSEEDGLQSYEFGGGAYYKSRRGELFLGGLDGFSAFFPESIKDNPYIPPVVITDFKIFNQSVPVGKAFNGRVILEKSITAVEAITLTRKHNTFSFDFAALNYVHSEKNEYAYMMEGVENSWNYVGPRRFVTYANLAPGEYIFRVKASNNHGAWNEDGVAVKIKILPPVWATWWFRLSLFILVLFLVLGIYRLRTRLILRRNRELEEVVAKRTVALRESGEKYRTVVERAHNGIAIVQDEKIVFQNTQFGNLLGYEEKDMVDHPLKQFVAPGKQTEVKDFPADSGKKKKPSGNFETTLHHKDGRDIHVEVNYGSITYRKRPALLMFFHDIGMQKLLEEERMKTAKLESTGVLVGGIAHDFNNLLAVILGNIELALTDLTPGDDIYRALSDAEKSGTKAADLVRQFITLSKADTPNKETKFIQDIIREAVRSVMQSSRVKCHFQLSENLWPVDCDALQIKQAIKNIVINSKQAMPDEQRAVLEVTAQNENLEADQVPNKAAGKYVCLSIKDNGTGIPREDLSKIFDPYFSTRNEVTQKGLGLGLSVVHSIITKHDGTIHVTSEKDVGTTVRICLPASSRGMI